MRDLKLQTFPFLVSYILPLTVVRMTIYIVCRTRYRKCTKCVAETHHTQTLLTIDCYNVQLSSLSFSIPPPSQLARMPSPVRNLTAAVIFDVTKSKIIANLSWIGPKTPYGKIVRYKIVLSSPKAAILISDTLEVKVRM